MEPMHQANRKESILDELNNLSIKLGTSPLTIAKGETIFSQGDRSDAIYFIQSGKVKISVVSDAGKEAVLAMLGPRQFFGEGSLTGVPHRMASASTVEPSVIYRVDKGLMVGALRDQTALSEKFLSALIMRNMDLEEDLCDHLFNQSEKRLARILLKLTSQREFDRMPNAPIEILSHEMLAEMVGTTRSRINHFMNKFRRMGLIDYNNHQYTVRTDLLADAVLHN